MLHAHEVSAARSPGSSQRPSQPTVKDLTLCALKTRHIFLSHRHHGGITFNRRDALQKFLFGEVWRTACADCRTAFEHDAEGDVIPGPHLWQFSHQSFPHIPQVNFWLMISLALLWLSSAAITCLFCSLLAFCHAWLWGKRPVMEGGPCFAQLCDSSLSLKKAGRSHNPFLSSVQQDWIIL